MPRDAAYSVDCVKLWTMHTIHHSKRLMGVVGYVPLSATTTRELHSRRPAVGGVRRGWHAGCDDGLRIRPNLSRNSVEHAGSSESGAQTRRLLELLAKFSPPHFFFIFYKITKSYHVGYSGPQFRAFPTTATLSNPPCVVRSNNLEPPPPMTLGSLLRALGAPIQSVEEGGKTTT